MRRQMAAKFSVQTDLTTPIVMVLSIFGNDAGIGRSGAWGSVARDEDSEDYCSTWRRVKFLMMIGKRGFFPLLVFL